MKPTVDQLIAALDLRPLPDEGGFYRQTWSLQSTNSRSAGTAILYLITPESFSALHKLDADEVFHFYLGDLCEQLTISPDGEIETTVLGPDLMHGQHVQSVVPAGSWQGTRLVAGGEWALIGTTMAPGYHPAGFELATLDHLRDLPVEVAARATSYVAEQA